MEKKVSIIVPCFNMENYIARFLDSVITQKYSNIELIMVNDESTDRTESIIRQYQEKLIGTGVEVIAITQKNKGLAGSMNTGLAIFTGDYLTWCDPDDFFLPDSIKKKVNFLEDNPRYGLVRTDCFIYSEKDLKTPVGVMSGKHPDRFNEEIFKNIILENNVLITAGCYMLRSSAFLNVVPGRYIYPARRGQNWQMLLPVTYQYKCGFIDEPLYGYVVRENSMSHTDNSLQVHLERCDEHEDILKSVISGLAVDQDYYNNLINAKYARRKLYLARVFGDQQLGKENYQKLKQIDTITKGDKLSYYMSQSRLFHVLGRGAMKIKWNLSDALIKVKIRNIVK